MDTDGQLLEEQLITERTFNLYCLNVWNMPATNSYMCGSCLHVQLIYTHVQIMRLQLIYTHVQIMRLQLIRNSYMWDKMQNGITDQSRHSHGYQERIDKFVELPPTLSFCPGRVLLQLRQEKEDLSLAPLGTHSHKL